MKEYFDLYFVWFKLGLFTFGGGYAMLPMIEKEVIEKKGWATSKEVLDYYAIGQVTPGIIAVNTATFIGYKVKGVLGGITATLGVISPSIVIILIIAGLISNFSSIEIVQNALNGIQIAVCVLMTFSIIKLFKGAVKDIYSLLIFVAVFLLAYFTSISIVLLTVLAAVAGVALYSMGKEGYDE